MLDPAASQRARFGPFELDLRSGELTNNGRRQTLPEQPLALLKALLERPGELVTRDELRHQLWPGDTFVDFEHGLNAAVKRLRDALGDSAESPRFIETVPRRGYRFVGPVEGTQGAVPTTVIAEPRIALSLPAASRTFRRRWWLTVSATTVVVLAAVAAWRLRPLAPTATGPDAPMRVVPLTTLLGREDVSTFSPDGNEVAFEHGGNGADPHENWGIYVMTIGSAEPTRLSADHRQDRILDLDPSWSPDGRYIAFLRAPPDQNPAGDRHIRIHLMSPFGGDALKLSDLPVLESPISWSPDSDYIVAGRDPTPPAKEDGGIYLIPTRGGNSRRLTMPNSTASDSAPSFSPDGRAIAYVHCADPDCSVNVLTLGSHYEPSGPPRRISVVRATIYKVAWARGGRFLIYDTYTSPWISYLWRVGVDGSVPPQRLELAGLDAMKATTTESRDRLIFSRGRMAPDIYAFEHDREARPVLTSSFADYDNDISPDGRRVAFASNRSGEQSEIWVAMVDGSDPQQLTHGPGTWQGSPHWSPDGRQIAFDSWDRDGYWHIWTIEAAGGSPERRTFSQGHQNDPTWSVDGRAIYYSASVRDGPRDVWRVTLDSRVEERITSTGSSLKAFEWGPAPSVVYQASDFDGPLLAQRLSDQSRRQIASCAHGDAFYARSGRIYYVGCESGNPSLHVVDSTNGSDRVLGRLAGYSGNGFNTISASPDGSVVLYQQVGSNTSDLWLIENFK